MPPIETIYLIHHSHTDIGYTHDQPVLWEMERRFINAALDACEQHLDHDGDHAFRWTVETIGPLLHWLDHTSDRQIERFLQLERARRLEVMGMFGNITPLMDTAELIELFQPLARLRRDYGLTIRHAMNCDVNGQNWGLVDVLLDAGITGFAMAINQHAGGAPLDRPNVFRWQAPSGRQILAFNGWHYMMGNDMRIGEDADELRDKWLPFIFNRLTEVAWPLPFIAIQITHPFGDNGTANYHLSAYVQAWNARGEAPRIRMATYADWWKAVQPYADQLQTHRGDWTDYWNFGCISSAREAAINRASRTRLLNADKLLGSLAPLGVHPQVGISAQAPGRQPADVLRAAAALRGRAWQALYLWDEHTWGADISVSQPENEDTAAQWNHKAHYAYEARSLSLLLQRDGIGELALHIPRAADDALILYNPLPWARTFTGLVPDHLARPRGTGDDPSASRHFQDRMTTPPSWWLQGVDVPANGYTVVTRDQLTGDATSRQHSHAKLTERNLPFRESAVVENAAHRLMFNIRHGGLVSWFDKRLGCELVDQAAAWTFGGIVYERIADQNHPAPRRLFYDQVMTVQAKRGWHPDWRAERWGARRLRLHRVYDVAGGIEVVQEVEVEGLDSPATCRVFLPHDATWVEFSAEWLMGMNMRPEATYIAMPFLLPNATARLDLGGQVMQPEVDQIPRCCRDYFTVQQWVDLSAEGAWGVTIACPDNPMVQLGDFHFGHDQSQFELQRALFLGWVTNNYWETNFRAYQPGRVSARYRVQPHDGGFKEADAHRFGAEASVPVVIQSAFEPSRSNAALPRTGSLLMLPQPPVLVLHVLPAWVQDDAVANAVYVRLLNASDTPQTAAIGSALLTIRAAQECDLLGTSLGALAMVDGTVQLVLPPRRVGIVRLEVV